MTAKKEISSISNSRIYPTFEIVAIAASAGGLKALQKVLSVLPADFPVAIAIVQHLSPQYRSLMAEILNRCTGLAVKQAAVGDRLSAGNVYIAPPNHHLRVNPDGSLSLSQAEREHFVRPAAEVLFQTVAESYGERAIAVVLTGGDSDGEQGVQTIKEKGGLVIAQDQETSQVFGMPSAAINTGCVDWILPINEIPQALMELVFQGKLSIIGTNK
ncbi:MAG: chemotaxis protein CheB [Kastovskya adunca ATA6-11-RM4]|jgi:two-component system chemotaxis response regulator CheB|nr:chemotaxis protein CheB [Kastovskya adunca ATA6-11-RM4]